MPRSPRHRIARQVYRDASGLAAVVYAGGQRRERRFAEGTDLRAIQRWQEQTRVELRASQPKAPRGSLEADVERYLGQIQQLRSWRERRAELRAWVARFGPMNRTRLTAEMVARTVGAWVADDVAPKTIRNRVWTLAHLYRTLDGPRVPTPCDDVALPRPLKVPPVAVPPATVVRVEQQLAAFEASGRLRDSRTRARFRVLAACGRRPSELMRAEPADVDLERRVWTPRNGKGGLSDPIWLNDEMLAAWELFVAADAWGPFETSAFARTLRSAGWPAGVRPYQLRHSVGIAMSDAGIDLADVQVHMGHTRIATTRRFYVPARAGRMQGASAAIDHRFGWAPAAAEEELNAEDTMSNGEPKTPSRKRAIKFGAKEPALKRKPSKKAAPRTPRTTAKKQ